MNATIYRTTSRNPIVYLDPSEVAEAIARTFEDLVFIETWGEKSFFYNPGEKLPHGVYFCTIKEKDGENDRGSNLYRQGVYRFNFGLPSKSFVELFGSKPKRPSKGETVVGPWDFTALDQLNPHPVYGWMAWVAILNPTSSSFHALRPLLTLSYEKAKKSYRRRLA